MTAHTVGTESEDATVAVGDFSLLEERMLATMTLGEAAAFFRNTAPQPAPEKKVVVISHCGSGLSGRALAKMLLRGALRVEMFDEAPHPVCAFNSDYDYDFDEDFLKAPYTPPKPSESWKALGAYTPTGVRKQQRAAKKKRRK